MECEVCYCNNANCKLVCGHSFCHVCVKTWYHKGANDGCPKCRKKLYFKRMPLKKWKSDAVQEKKDAVYNEAFDEILEMAKDDEFPSWLVMDELVMMEKTYSFLKKCGEEITDEDLEYILNESGDYYSDRKIHSPNKSGTKNFDGDFHRRNKWESSRISNNRPQGKIRRF